MKITFQRNRFFNFSLLFKLCIYFQMSPSQMSNDDLTYVYADIVKCNKKIREAEVFVFSIKKNL